MWLIALAVGQVTTNSGQLPSIDAPLTFRHEAARLPVMLGLIGAETGFQFKVSPEVEREVVIVSVKGKPLGSVLAKIADVSSSKYVVTGNAIEFLPDKAKWGRQSAQQMTDRRKRIAEAMLAAQKLLGIMNAMENQAKSATPQAEEDDGPDMGVEQQAALVAALQLPHDVLGRIEPGERTVFSTSPTQMQVGFDGSPLLPYVERWVKEYNTGVDASQKAQQDGAAVASDSASSIFTPVPMKKIATAPSRILCVVSNRDGEESLELKVFDAKGRQLLQSVTALDPENLREEAVQLQEQAKEMAKPVANDTAAAAAVRDTDVAVAPGQEMPQMPPIGETITLSQRSTDFVKQAFAMRDMSNLATGLSKNDLLKHPDTDDPLSYVVSEYLLARADKHNEDLVGDLPDTLFNLYSNGGRGDALFPKPLKGNATDEEKAQFDSGANASRDVATAKEADGFLTVVPFDPVATRDRIDRIGMTEVMKHAEEPVGSLDRLANFAVGSDNPMSVFGYAYSAAFSPADFMGGDWQMLRLYGLLGSSDRDTLRSGQPITFQSMGNKQQAQLGHMIFGIDGRLSPLAMTNKFMNVMVTGDFDMEMYKSFASTMENDAEPTDLCPNGIPAQAVLTLKGISQPYLSQSTPGASMFGTRGMGAVELASMQVMMETPAFAAVASQMPTGQKYFLGERELMLLNFAVAPDRGLVGNLTDVKSIDKSNSYTLDNLPPDLAAQVASAKDKLKKSKIYEMIGSLAGNTGPGPIKP